MRFIVVEKKEEQGLYTIYDEANKGVCCCTLQTLVTLRNMKHNVHGLVGQGDNMRVFECTLAGEKRKYKAPVICERLTPVPVSIIAKGLPAQNFPKASAEPNTTPNGTVSITHGSLYIATDTTNRQYFCTKLDGCIYGVCNGVVKAFHVGDLHDVRLIQAKQIPHSMLEAVKAYRFTQSLQESIAAVKQKLADMQIELQTATKRASNSSHYAVQDCQAILNGGGSVQEQRNECEERNEDVFYMVSAHTIPPIFHAGASTKPIYPVDKARATYTIQTTARPIYYAKRSLPDCTVIESGVEISKNFAEELIDRPLVVVEATPARIQVTEFIIK